ARITTGSERYDRIALLSIVVISLLFHLTYYRYGVQNLVDLGVACVDSDRILNGQVPGVDFFDSYGPARFYMIALAFAVAGKSLLTLSALCVILLAIKDALVYVTARDLVSKRWALFVAALSIMVHGPIHKVFLSLAILLILVAAFRLIRRPGWKAAFVFGLAVFLAGTLRYDMGAAGMIIGFLLVAALPLAARFSKKLFLPALSGFLAGLALPGLFLTAWYYHIGVDFLVLIDNHVKRVTCLEQANQDKLGILTLPFSDQPVDFLLGYTLLFLALILAFALFAAIRLWRRAEGTDRRTALMLGVMIALGALSFNHIRLGVKFLRIGQVGAPFFIALAYLLMHAFVILKNRGSCLRWVPPCLAVGFFIFLGLYIWNFEGAYSQDSFAVLRIRSHYLDHPRGGCAFRGKRGEEVEEVIAFIEQRTAPGEAIFTTAACPLLHFLTDRPDPTPFTDFAFYYFDEKNQNLVIEKIREANVRYIIDWPRPLTGFWFKTCAPLVFDYVNTHFKVERQIGRFVIMKRREESD
ncbi:MAG: hypothetical protein ABIK28_19425, partial [Planctomycetota bacterium]